MIVSSIEAGSVMLRAFLPYLFSRDDLEVLQSSDLCDS